MDTRTVTDINDTDFEALVSRLGAVPEGATPEQAANVLFPNDKEGQREYLEQARELQEAADEAQAPPKPGPKQQGASPQAAPVAIALPGVLAALVPVIALCVAGGLRRVGINEIRTLVRKGRWATAEERIHGFVRGCIGSVVPRFVRRLARRFSRHIAKLVLRAIL